MSTTADHQNIPEHSSLNVTMVIQSRENTFIDPNMLESTSREAKHAVHHPQIVDSIRNLRVASNTPAPVTTEPCSQEEYTARLMQSWERAQALSNAPGPHYVTMVNDQPILQDARSMSRAMIRLDDHSTVEEFVKHQLKRMQQLIDKKIAKAWIKGICPKKQARYPYRNKNSKDADDDMGPQTMVPWWPIRQCRYIEPDHIKRDERTHLLLHMLFLRPTIAQLKEWNGETWEPHPTLLNKGWTAFLEELAGPSIFEDHLADSEERTQYRKLLMRQMYDFAGMEESFLAVRWDRRSPIAFDWPHDDRDKRSDSDEDRQSVGKRTRDHTEEREDAYAPRQLPDPSPRGSIGKRHRSSDARATTMTAPHTIPMMAGCVGHPQPQAHLAGSFTSAHPALHASFASSASTSFDGGFTSFSSQTSQCPSDTSVDVCAQMSFHRQPIAPAAHSASTAVIKRELTPVLQDPAMWDKQEREATAMRAASTTITRSPAQVPYCNPSSPPTRNNTPLSSASVEQSGPVGWVAQPVWAGQHPSPPQFTTPVWSVHEIPQPYICDVSLGGDMSQPSSFVDLHPGLMSAARSSSSASSGNGVPTQGYCDALTFSPAEHQAMYPHYVSPSARSRL